MSGQFRLFVEPLLVRVQGRGVQRHFFQLPKRSGARFVPIDHIVTGGTGTMQARAVAHHEGKVGQPLVHLFERERGLCVGHRVALRSSGAVADILLVHHTAKGPFVAHFFQLPELSHLAFVAHFAAHHVVRRGARGEHAFGIGHIAHQVVFSLHRGVHARGIAAHAFFHIGFRHIGHRFKLPFCCRVGEESGIGHLAHRVGLGAKRAGIAAHHVLIRRLGETRTVGEIGIAAHVEKAVCRLQEIQPKPIVPYARADPSTGFGRRGETAGRRIAQGKAVAVALHQPNGREVGRTDLRSGFQGVCGCVDRPIVLRGILHAVETAGAQPVEGLEALFQLRPSGVELRHALQLLGREGNKLPVVGFGRNAFPILHKAAAPVVPERFPAELFGRRNHPIAGAARTGGSLDVVVCGIRAHGEGLVEPVERLDGQLLAHVHDPVGAIHLFYLPILRQLIVPAAAPRVFGDVAQAMMLHQHGKIVFPAHDAVKPVGQRAALRENRRETPQHDEQEYEHSSQKLVHIILHFNWILKRRGSFHPAVAFAPSVQPNDGATYA